MVIPLNQEKPLGYYSPILQCHLYSTFRVGVETGAKVIGDRIGFAPIRFVSGLEMFFLLLLFRNVIYTALFELELKAETNSGL